MKSPNKNKENNKVDNQNNMQSDTKTKAKKYEDASVKKIPKSKVQITAKINAETLASHKNRTIESFNKSITVDGFRKGNVPEHIINQKVGPEAILREMAYIAIEDAYPHIAFDQKLSVISTPEVKILKLSKEDGVEFSIDVETLPEIEISGYAEIAKEVYSKKSEKSDKEDVESPTEKEQEEVIQKILHSYVHHKQHGNNPHNHDHNHDHNEKLPELTDELVKELGQFKDVADFKEKVKSGIIEEKRIRIKEKKRAELIEKLIEKGKGEIPNSLIENELEYIEQQFKGDMQNMGISADDYLKHNKKTWEDMRKDWAEDAEKRAKIKLILVEIAKKEKLLPKDEDVETEVKAMMSHYKNANIERVRAYAYTVLTNENVFAFLEKNV